MTTTFSDSALPSHSGLIASFCEPLLAAGAALFWMAALPFVAVALLVVKIWDTTVALLSGRSLRPNPLILRRGVARPASADASAHAAQA